MLGKEECCEYRPQSRQLTESVRRTRPSLTERSEERRRDHRREAAKERGGQSCTNLTISELSFVCLSPVSPSFRHHVSLARQPSARLLVDRKLLIQLSHFRRRQDASFIDSQIGDPAIQRAREVKIGIANAE